MDKELGIGSMLGHMNFSDLSQQEKHGVTVVAKTDGLIAVIPTGEEKREFKQNPVGVSGSVDLKLLLAI